MTARRGGSEKLSFDRLAMRWRRIALAAMVAFGAAVGWLLYSEPHLRVYLCPACSGFRHVAPQVYVDADATDAQVRRGLEDLATAKRQVLDFYPALVSDPVWLLCLSDSCRAGSVPRPLAMAYTNVFVFVYPEGANPTILAHELAHTELRQRLGSVLLRMSAAVPAWFDDGLAVVISRDTQYLTLDDGQVTGCRTAGLPEPPSDRRSFRRLGATRAQDRYTASACKVISWLEDKGGPQAVLAMLDSLRAGQPFVE